MSHANGALGLIGRKVGMMRIFADDGVSIPVTVLDVSNNRITQVKTVEKDGYSAIQVTAGKRRANRITKPMAGHYAKAGTEGGTGMREFRAEPELIGDLAVGSEVKAELFVEGQYVDVSGTSIGKGFSGTIKRHNFKSQRASHGNSVSHNVPGSIGMAQDPGRVFPGKRMSGQYGNTGSTVQNLVVARVDSERQLIMIRGAVPGSRNAEVVVMPAVKKPAPEPRAMTAEAPAEAAADADKSE